MFVYLGDQELLAEDIDLGHEILGGLLRDLAWVLVAGELQLSRAAREVADEAV
jgi:hypothetical protein